MPGAFLPFCPLGYFFSLRLSVELFLRLFSRPGCSRRHPRPPPRACGSSAVWHEPRGQGVQGETPSRPLRRPFTSSPAAPPWGERLRGTDVFWLRRVCVWGGAGLFTAVALLVGPAFNSLTGSDLAGQEQNDF